MELEKERERINAELLKEATYRDPGAARDLQYRLAELERDLESPPTIRLNKISKKPQLGGNR